jgi:hypothetical protein
MGEETKEYQTDPKGEGAERKKGGLRYESSSLRST